MRKNYIRFICLWVGFLIFFFLAFANSSSAGPQVSAGYYHTLLVKSDGTLWA